MAELNPLYDGMQVCPMCEQSFHVTKVRSRLKSLRQDRDFYVQYQEVNPYWYAVWVCPHCGYAALDTQFEQLMERQKQILSKELQGKPVKLDLCGERTLQQAIISYKLALYFAEQISWPESYIAGLFLKLAWLFRDHDEQQEMLNIGYALQHYQQAYEQERFPIGGRMTEVTLSYLIGELARRIKNYELAAKWFGLTIHSHMAKSEPKILNMARDGWEEIREQLAVIKEHSGQTNRT